MISRKNAPKVWDRNTRVIEKGSKDWTSDHPERRGESYGTNPLSLIDQKIRVAKSHSYSTDGLPDPSRLPLDARAKTAVGPDIYEFRVCEKNGAHEWRRWAIHRWAAL